MNNLKLIVSLSLLGIGFLFASCRENHEKSAAVYRIGAVLPMTGAQASFGVSAKKGLELAIERLNAEKGILGKSVELIALDDRSLSEEAALAVTKLITQDKVDVVIGEIASSRSLAMAPIAQNFGVPMISPGATNPGVTQVGNFIFRVCFIDPFQGKVMAQFSSKSLKMKKVAVLDDMKSDYSVGLSQFFIEEFKRLGGTVVAHQNYGTGDIDFKSQLTAIKSKNPQGIFVPGSYLEVGMIARQARELGIDVPLLGGDDWDSPRLLEIASEALEGSYFSNHFSEEDQSRGVQDFIKRYKEKFAVSPDGLSVLAFDSVGILVDAIKRAKGFEPNHVREALSNTKDYLGVTGKIAIDSERNAIKPVVILKIKKSAFTFAATVLPMN